MDKQNKLVVIISAFFAIYVIWGSTYMFNKIAVGELAPFMLASVRFITAGLFIFIIASILGISIKINKRKLSNTTIAGLSFFDFWKWTSGLGIKVCR